MSKIYDLIIVGAGPAGITASIYAARKKMDILVLTGDIGGQTAWSGDIENYVGYQFITGVELTMKFEEHMKKYGVEVRENEEMTGIAREKDTIKITTGKGVYKAGTAVIATGKRSKELNVPGEKEFRNKGIAYCATCDAPLFGGKDVAVIGGGNSALEAVLQLIKIAKHVYIINITDKLEGDAIIRDKAVSADNVTVINNSSVLAIEGDSLVEKVRIGSGGEERTIEVQGVFVEIGLSPNTGFKSDIDLNERGEIIVNSRNETNIPGVFAAGDVTDVVEKQIIIAAGEGAKAALGSFKYLAQQ